MTRSSSGLGHLVFIQATGVRFPYALPLMCLSFKTPNILKCPSKASYRFFKAYTFNAFTSAGNIEVAPPYYTSNLETLHIGKEIVSDRKEKGFSENITLAELKKGKVGHGIHLFAVPIKSIIAERTDKDTILRHRPAVAVRKTGNRDIRTWDGAVWVELSISPKDFVVKEDTDLTLFDITYTDAGVELARTGLRGQCYHMVVNKATVKRIIIPGAYEMDAQLKRGVKKTK